MVEDPKEIEQVRSEFKFVLREKFDEKKFDEDIQSGQKITVADILKYRKKTSEDISKSHKTEKNIDALCNQSGMKWVCHMHNGEYIATGPKGQIIQSKNLDDFNRKLAKIFKLYNLQHKEEGVCTYHTNAQGEEYQKKTESFARNFLNEGLTINGDVPKSKEFWKQMKQEFLSKENHTQAEWDKITRFIPKEYMKESNHSLSPQQRQYLNAQSGRI